MFDFTKSKKDGSTPAKKGELVSRYVNRRMQKAEKLNAVCYYYNKTKDDFEKKGLDYEFRVMELTDEEERLMSRPSVITETLLDQVQLDNSLFLIGQTDETKKNFIMDVYDGVDPEGIIHVEDGQYTEITLDELYRKYDRDMFLERTDNEGSVSSVMNQFHKERQTGKEKEDDSFELPTLPKMKVVSVHDPSTAPLMDGPFEL